MIIVLLSGGSGKKLWPLSNDIRSKQFIQLFKNENEEPESMIQRVYNQVKATFDDADIIVATSKSQASTVFTQLGEDIAVSCEPSRKGTFPATLLALENLSLSKEYSKDETVLTCPVDLFVEKSFFQQIKESLPAIKGDEILLVGTEPANPSDRYGYIVPVDDATCTQAKQFIEKATKVDAENLINEGAFWNSGIYLFCLDEFLSYAHKQYDYSDYDDLVKEYKTIPECSLDSVVEKNKNLTVIHSLEPLRDLGTWKSITNAMQENVIGNAKVSDTCKNVSVINDMDIPIYVKGVQDVIVSASSQGILVSKKEESTDVGDDIDEFDNAVMFADKSWGSLNVLDISDDSMTIKLHINAGKQMSYHSHERRDEMWTILSGKGKTIVDGMEQPVKAGDVITMEAGCRHTIIAEDDLDVIEIQRGSEITVNDKKKFELE